MLFQDIAGNDKIIKYLKNSVLNNLVSHGYIFEGSDKKLINDTALAFSQSLLCKNFNGDCCDKCNDCLKVCTYNHPDIHIIEPDEKHNIRKEVVEEIIKSVNVKSYEKGYKIFIIKDCDKMTLSAANSFLKTLEEPVKNTVIILLTDNHLKLLDTISSRCQLIHFDNIKINEIVKYIIDKYNVDNEKANIIAYYSQGILKKADDIVNLNCDILKKREVVIELFDKIIKKDKTILYTYDKFFDDNKQDIGNFINLIIIWLRDLLFCSQNLKDLIINIDYYNILKEQAKNYNVLDIYDDIICLQKVVDDIKYNVNYKLSISIILLRLMEGVNK